MWKHAYQKVGALVSRSHHHWQQGMNGYEAMFMNILLALIFFFQLPITRFSFASTLFPFGCLICFSSLFLSHRCFSLWRLRTLSPLPWGASQRFQILFKPNESFTQSFKRDKCFTTKVQRRNSSPIIFFLQFFPFFFKSIVGEARLSSQNILAPIFR